VSAAGGRARVAVRDLGIGVPVADRERIFGRFERAVSDRSHGGLGLGLWISRELAAAMGGTVTVADAAERGSVFTVELPLTPGR
jgi:signal transduction histidine kinase